MTKILVIDDERSIRNTLKEILEYENYIVELAEDGASALELIKVNNFGVILCDIKMEGMDGIEVLERVKKSHPDIPVVMISGHGNVDIAVECIKKGAYDFIEKPLDLNRVLVTIRNAMDKSELVTETKKLRKRVNKVDEIVGISEQICKVKEMIDKVAASSFAKILIVGANGTGKELVARWLHEKSERNTAPFIEVNCAAIPSELIESELFGHEKGAFTSAVKQHKGKFEQANGGTLFLDEIGDMSLSAQAKVLRVLQENKVNRVGGDKDIDVDVKVIAATNKDLFKEIQNGTFREDLYHRLSVVIIKVPKLADRIEDLPLLVDAFIDKICEENRMAKRQITPEAIELLKQKPWTGNVRELRNVIERLLILGGKPISAEDVEQYV